MSWFIVALGAPFVWSLVNHCDKIILQRYFKGGGSGGLMIFVGVIALPISVLIALFNPSVLSVSFNYIFSLIVSGLFYNIGVYLYLKALEREDASYIVAFWQLVPVFAYLFGIVFLGEYLEINKIIAGLIVMLGAVLLSIKFESTTKLTINKRTALIMVSSSLVLALGYVLFKDSEGGEFWPSMFWNQIGMLIFGGVFLLIKPFRREFLDVIKQNSAGVLALNIFEQTIEVVGIFINNFALLLAPAALVILVEYTAQPVFVFIEGIIFTIIFPKFVQEDISRNNLIQKFISIAIMGIGLYMITN
ncbi:MAG: EamA family transporter [Patescibacteria group bacterium]